MMRFSRVFWAGVLVSSLAAVLGVVVSWPYWLYVGRSDLAAPRGVYLCLFRDEARRLRLCRIGVDGILLREERLPDGSLERQWFSHGRDECLRETLSPSGDVRAAGPNTCAMAVSPEIRRGG